MDNKLYFETQFGERKKMVIEINMYVNNGCMYIGLQEQVEDYFEPYGDLTVNLEGKVPDYCGYVDVNNMPQIEKFIVDNDIGEFTGLSKKSGFCEYPLYLFNVDKLRELCPEGMKMYESAINKEKELSVQEKVR